MKIEQLFDNIKRKNSFLCIGLDSDPEKIPAHLLTLEDPVFEFNRAIIDSTHDLVIAYKPNTAFYECRGQKGMESLRKTVEYLNENHPDIFVIADAKRGDIGNTSAMYAKTFFDGKSSGMEFDALTVNPYMGRDSVAPFLTYKNKWVILLALTSNYGANDFQLFHDFDYNRLFEKVLRQSQRWGTYQNMMYVVGATKAEMLADIRKIIPMHFLLVPGVGAQGGSLHDVARFGMNAQCGLIVNSSRGVLYAGKNKNFNKAARKVAQDIQHEMKELLKEYLPV